jgi:hypothetical protein
MHERHQIVVEAKFTRIPPAAERSHVRHVDSYNDNDNNKLSIKDPGSRRLRKASDYLPEQFELQRKQNSFANQHNIASSRMLRTYSRSSFSRTSLKDDDATSKKEIKRTYSNEVSE